MEVLVFSYIHWLGSIFWVQNFEFQYFFIFFIFFFFFFFFFIYLFFFWGGGGVQKNEYFWGMKILWIFLGVVTKLDYTGWVVTWFLLGYTVRMFEYTVRTF